MDALGDREEVRIALDHNQRASTPSAADIGEQRLQHLGDTAAGRRRIDVEHRAALERLLGRGGDLLEARQRAGPISGSSRAASSASTCTSCRRVTRSPWAISQLFPGHERARRRRPGGVAAGNAASRRLARATRHGSTGARHGSTGAAAYAARSALRSRRASWVAGHDAAGASGPRTRDAASVLTRVSRATTLASTEG